MTANTPSSRKSKGRKLQQWVRDLILQYSHLEPDDVRSAPMGVNGEDIQLSPDARRVLPYAIECKAADKVNLWNAYAQAVSNKGDYEPLLVLKRNYQKPLAVIDADYLLRLLLCYE